MDKQNIQDLEKSLYSEKSLSLLNIRDLRDMGRKFGVPSPTTKNKKELVDYILKIVYGEVEVPVRSVYGRPSVREFDMDKYLNKIKKNSVIRPDSIRFMLNEQPFESKLASPSEEYDIGELIEQRVFVEEDNKCFLRIHAFVDSEEDIEISKDLAKRYKLENLDMIEIVLNKNTFKIISVNGVKIENKLDGLKVDGEPVKAGESHIFHCSTKEEIEKNITKLKTAIGLQKIKMIAFSPEKYDGEHVQTIEFSDTDGASLVYKKLMQFVGVCEKDALEGENFVMVINRGELIDSLIMNLDEDVLERIKKHLRETILKILSFGNVLYVYNLEKDIIY